jgi:hypothetical protein
MYDRARKQDSAYGSGQSGIVTSGKAATLRHAKADFQRDWDAVSCWLTADAGSMIWRIHMIRLIEKKIWPQEFTGALVNDQSPSADWGASVISLYFGEGHTRYDAELIVLQNLIFLTPCVVHHHQKFALLKIPLDHWTRSFEKPG